MKSKKEKTEYSLLQSNKRRCFLLGQFLAEGFLIGLIIVIIFIFIGKPGALWFLLIPGVYGLITIWCFIDYFRYKKKIAMYLNSLSVEERALLKRIEAMEDDEEKENVEDENDEET